MQNQIDTLRQLNYELIKNLGLFKIGRAHV